MEHIDGKKIGVTILSWTLEGQEKQQKHDFVPYFGLKILQDQVFHNSLSVFIHYLSHFS